MKSGEKPGEPWDRGSMGTSPAPVEAVKLVAKTRVVLADDHSILREALVRLLQEEPDLEVVGQASDGISAVAMVQERRPDVIIMDISMPGMNGIEATKVIASRFSGVKVIGFTMHEDQEVLHTMKRAGACATVTKGDPPRILVRLVRECAGRDSFGNVRSSPS